MAERVCCSILFSNAHPQVRQKFCPLRVSIFVCTLVVEVYRASQARGEVRAGVAQSVEQRFRKP